MSAPQVQSEYARQTNAGRLPLLQELSSTPYLLAPVSVDDWHFQPDPQGRAAVIIGISDFSEVYDAVCFFSDSPRRWWTFRGAASLLGERAVRLAAANRRPVVLLETPQKWLWRTTCEGERFCCLLDWRSDPRLLLPFVGHVECETPALQRRLEDAIARHSRPPFVISGERVQASDAA